MIVTKPHPRRGTLRPFSTSILPAILILISTLILPAHGTPPTKQQFELLSPAPRATITGTNIPIKGRVEKGNRVFINGQEAAVNWQGNFSIQQAGHLGKNIIRIQVLNLKNASTNDYQTVVYCLNDFPDVSGHWAAKEIGRLTTYLGISGRLGTRFFQPDHNITRAELMRYLVLISSVPFTSPKRTRFRDVLPTDWFFPHVESAFAHFGIAGTSPDHFSPEGLVSRADLVHIALKFRNHFLKHNPGTPISNANSPSRALSDLAAAKSLGLLPPQWTLKKDLYPYRPATHAESITVLSRIAAVSQKLSKYYGNTITIKPHITKPTNPPKTPAKSPSPLFPNPVAHTWTTTTPSKPNLHHIQLQTNQTLKIDRIFLDLTDLNGIPNFELRDDGTWGDAQANDQKFSGDLRLSPKTHLTEIGIPATFISDKKIVAKSMIRFPTTAKRPYLILKGDTLPKIANKLLGDSSKWKTIARHNGLPIITRESKNGTVYDCKIIAGETIQIPYKLAHNPVGK